MTERDIVLAQKPTHYLVSYNTKSATGHGLSSGSATVPADKFGEWVAGAIRRTGWPVIITSMKEV